jgi:hypothetical protein
MTPISAYKERERGITLFEIVLGIGMGALLLMVLAGTIALMFESRIRQSLVKEVMDSGALIMDIMTDSVTHATAITEPNPGDTGIQLDMTTEHDTYPSSIIWDTEEQTLYAVRNNDTIPLHNNRITVTDFSVTTVDQEEGAQMATYNFALHAEHPVRSSYQYTETFSGILRIGYE